MMEREETHPTAGMYEQYSGHVGVHVDSDDADTVFSAAVLKLSRTSFPDRPGRDFWRMDSFEVLND